MGLFRINIFGKLQTPLEKYGIEKQPTRREVTKSDDGRRSTTNRVFNGKQYVATKDPGSQTIDWETIDTRSQRSTGEKQKHITGWDKAFLDDKIGNGRWNQVVAEVVKVHWVEGDSAAKIESKHRDRGGVLEFGFSERNVKQYLFAFNRAFEKEVEQIETSKSGAT